jgi:hypothetical protein
VGPGLRSSEWAYTNKAVGLIFEENQIVDPPGGVASSISLELYCVRISPIREGVGVKCGGCAVFAERLRIGVVGTRGTLNVADSSTATSHGEAFFTRFRWFRGGTSSRFVLFLVADEAEGDIPFNLAANAVEFLEERRRDIASQTLDGGPASRTLRQLVSLRVVPSGPPPKPAGPIQKQLTLRSTIRESLTRHGVSRLMPSSVAKGGHRLAILRLVKGDKILVLVS